MVSGKINYGVTGIQQLFCDAVGQKSFADAGVTEKQQILKGIIKGIYKTMALNYGVSGSFQGGQLCVVVNVIGIIVVGKRVKIFLFQNALQIGLGVDQVNGWPASDSGSVSGRYSRCPDSPGRYRVAENNLPDNRHFADVSCLRAERVWI